MRLLLSGRARRPTVLMYHSIGLNPASFTVSTEIFRRQIAFLRARDYRVLPLEDCVRRGLSGETGRIVALTFDDGYRDFVDEAAPILQAFDCPATVFLITGRMGGSFTTSDRVELPIMSWRDAAHLRTTGIELGSHTVSHAKLNHLSSDQVRDELTTSLAAMASQAGATGDVWLSYPYGRCTDEVKRIAREVGYAGALTIGPGHPGQRTDRFGVPRQYVHSAMGMKQFEACLA